MLSAVELHTKGQMVLFSDKAKLYSDTSSQLAKEVMQVLLLLLLAVVSTRCADFKARLSLLQPRGLRIEIDDVAGASLVAVHYSVNKQLTGVQAGQWNYDITSKTGNKWIHENRLVDVKEGDVVNYWTYLVINRLGKQFTDQKWVASSGAGSSGSSGSAGSPVAPVEPAQASAGDADLGGRSLRLVLEDTFDGPFDTSKWNQEVTLWGGGNWEFQAYTNLADNTFTKNGALHLKPTLTADKYGESFLTTGRWDIKQMYGTCTQASSYGCLREGKNGVLNPAMSGRITSKATIKYGKVEIMAKAPRGDWLWPALWMYPKSHTYGGWPRSGEIDIMESRGNRHYGNLGVEYMGTTLHWGTQHVNRYGMTTKHNKAKCKTLADGFHKYTFYWTEAGMKFYLDDEKVAEFPTPKQGFFRWGNLPGQNIWSHALNAPFDHEFYLIINLAVGGTNGFFPDNVSNAGYNKPWRNTDSNGPEKFWKAKNLWYPTWKGDDASFQIDSVRIWQLV